jgi:hypothetical protein
LPRTALIKWRRFIFALETHWRIGRPRPGDSIANKRLPETVCLFKDALELAAGRSAAKYQAALLSQM